jgi:hypothetical protein
MRETLTDLLRELESSRFYGSVELKFENGHVTIARKAETLKFTRPNHSRDNRGKKNEENKIM